MTKGTLMGIRHSLRNGGVNIYIEYGNSISGNLFAYDLQVRAGQAVTLVMNLDLNLRALNKASPTYNDADGLAQGKIRELRRLVISDNILVERLQEYLGTSEVRNGQRWEVIIILNGEHNFSVRPEYRQANAAQSLILHRITGL